MDEVQESTPALQGKYKGYANLKPYQFKPGQSGNPTGKRVYPLRNGLATIKEFSDNEMKRFSVEPDSRNLFAHQSLNSAVYVSTETQAEQEAQESET